MVTRKPVGPPVDTAQASSASNALPYPTTPPAESAKTGSSIYSDDLKTSPAFDLIDVNEARQRPRRDSDVSSHGTWDSDGTERDEQDTPEESAVEVPKPLNIRASQQDISKTVHQGDGDELPASLRPGPTKGAIVGTRSAESQHYEQETQSNPWQLESNNPYLQSKAKHQPNGYDEGSQKVWEQPLRQLSPQPARTPPPQPSSAPPAPPVELPTVKTPSEELSRMSLYERTSAGTMASYETAEVLPVPGQGQAAFGSAEEASASGGQAFPPSNPWSDRQDYKHSVPAAPPKEELSPLKHSSPPEHEYTPPPGPPPGTGPLIDHVEAIRPHPPTLAPGSSPMQSTESVPETPGTRQKKECYQIKHIRWYDSASGKAGMRESPVLTQNANGPCPLLALVNALVLSTPPDLDTPLVQELRRREQVTLGFLLDAVFDELMSGRRGGSEHQLPDVSELYAFLLALHTGMNVNPRFVTPALTPRGSMDIHPPDTNGMHPSQRAQQKPGCFEETREMRLYSTFNIPLIHGWTAPKDTPAYMAFQRSAPTFEDAQNIQFAGAELEDKLRSEGLSFQEQQTLEDIQTIKSFLQTWPTQLTDYGLETMSRSLQPAQIAILFRNDHFSTLYKEPRHGALMTLVTDTGYSSHDEIVWESLVDVNGAASEMFSGDFRTVSHGQDARPGHNSSGGDGERWQTVAAPNQQSHPQQALGRDESAEGEAPPLPGPRPTAQDHDLTAPQAEVQQTTSEQEDHDLALALQLQEEEEDEHRRAEERRRRERELSEQFLSNEEQPPAIPPRRQQGRTSQQSFGRRATGPQARPAVSRPADSGDPDAPPTYEQSASDRPYRPAGATAPPSQGNPLNALDALRRQQSAYAQNSSTSVNSLPQHNRRQSQGNRIQRRSSQLGSGPAPAYPGRVGQAATIKDTDERCVVM